MTNSPTVSIIICTSNRAEHLRHTLEAMQTVEAPTGGCELIVVDNASTDSTAEVVAQCVLPQMAVRYVSEPRRGKGYAYNKGLDASRGEIILLTDDDVCPPSNWLNEMCRPIISGGVDVVAGGVEIAPSLLRSWMEPLHKDFLASTENMDPNNPPGALGANVAFSSSVLNKVPAFDVELGPGALGFCDDNLFSNQLKQAGYHIATAFHVSVTHHFDPSRLTRQSWLNRAIQQGQSGAYLAHHWEHQEISDVHLRIVKCYLRLLWSRLQHQSDCRVQEGIPIWEMNILSSLAFYKQFAREQKRHRNYEKHGLLKLDHIN